MSTQTMTKPEQLELGLETGGAKSIEPSALTGSIPPEAEDFLVAHGFDSHTIAILERAHFKPGQTRGSFSLLKGAERKKRLLDIPDPELMKPFQRWLHAAVLSPYQEHLSDIACGIGGRQLQSMVEPHLGNQYFFKADIKDAYQSVDLRHLAIFLATLGDTPVEQWHAILTKFCGGRDGGLATGGIVSPLLFNLYMTPLDDEFSGLAVNNGMAVTRYMDDIVFSSANPIGKRRASTIKNKLRGHGLAVNQHKVRYHNLEEDGPFMITGLQINPGGNWQLAHRYLRNIDRFFRETLEELQTHGDIDLETMGTIRGLRGHVLMCTSQERPKTVLEQQIFDTYHRLERKYRQKHPH